MPNTASPKKNELMSLHNLNIRTALTLFLLLCMSTPSFAQDAAPAGAIDEVEDDGESELSEAIQQDTTADAPDVELQLDKTKKDKKTIIRTVARKDSLSTILQSNGLTNAEIYSLLAQPDWPKHYILIPGTRYLITTSKTSDLVEIALFIPRSSEVLIVSKEGGKTGLRKEEFEYDIRIKEVSGEVKGSLYGSIRSVASDPFIALRFLDAYSLDYKLGKQVRRGAKFSVIYEEKTLNGQYVAPGEVLYTSVELDGRKQERHFVKAFEGGAFVAFDADHDMRPFYAPVEYLHISSPFNPRRFHPVRRRRIPHRGTDFALNHGSSVLAALDGNIIRMGRNKAAGLFIVIEHKNGYQTEYVHMSSVDPKMRIGLQVSSGQRIGAVGCTGYCTRPHLHFGISKNGTHVDPIKYLRPYSVRQESRVQAYATCVAKNSVRVCSEQMRSLATNDSQKRSKANVN